MQNSPGIRTVASQYYGGPGGDYWDDGMLYDGVKEIHLRYGAGIDSIGFTYSLNGGSVGPWTHGGPGGDSKNITLDYPDEYITNISGDYYTADWDVRKPVIIRSIKFQTNVRSYGPYGEEIGKHFDFNIGGKKVVGFYGRSGANLDAIGVHVISQ